MGSDQTTREESVLASAARALAEAVSDRRFDDAEGALVIAFGVGLLAMAEGTTAGTDSGP